LPVTPAVRLWLWAMGGLSFGFDTHLPLGSNWHARGWTGVAAALTNQQQQGAGAPGCDTAALFGAPPQAHARGWTGVAATLTNFGGGEGWTRTRLLARLACTGSWVEVAPGVTRRLACHGHNGTCACVVGATVLHGPKHCTRRAHARELLCIHIRQVHAGEEARRARLALHGCAARDGGAGGCRERLAARPAARPAAASCRRSCARRTGALARRTGTRRCWGCTTRPRSRG
jgi:hypothetical protein